MDWLDLLSVQGTLKSLLQCHSLKASILQHSAFFMVQLSLDYTVHRILQARILEWVASHFLLQGIIPTQGLNPGLPHCKRILYQLSYQGSPYIEFLKFSDKKKNKAIKNGQRI